MAAVLWVNRSCQKVGLMIFITSITMISGYNNKMVKGHDFLQMAISGRNGTGAIRAKKLPARSEFMGSGYGLTAQRDW